jgi:predicted ABC-type ATPase
VAGLLAFLRQAPLLVRAGLQFDADRLALQGTRLAFGLVRVNSYHASVLADFIRQHLLASRTSFTFETVMSSADKVEFLRCAREGGFRTYLYFVATEDPEINISRVQHRVRTGGHPVPTDKIVSRYHRSLDLLPEALAHTSRAYVFDNSGHERVLVAEVTDGVELEMKTDGVPAWFAGALGLDTPPEVTGV